MAKKKNNNMKEQVVSGLYLFSVASIFTILSRLAGNIMYGGSESETIKEQEIKKLQEIIANINAIEEEDDISRYLDGIITLEPNDKSVITFSELGKYYHFNTLYDILPKDQYTEACGGPEDALGHHKFGKTKLGGTMWDVILGISMPFIILYYSIKLIYKSINPGGRVTVKDNNTDKYSISNFSNRLRSFINSDVVPDSYIKRIEKGSEVTKKKLKILGGLNPIGGVNFDTIQKAWVFIIQMVFFLLIFAPLVFLTSKPSASEFAMTGLLCNAVYIMAVLGFISMNGGIKSFWDVIMNCKLKIYCFNFIIAMGIWYLLFTIVVKDKKIENSTTGMGVALIFIIAVLSGDYLMSRSKK